MIDHVGLILFRAGFATVEPASTLATLDKFQHVAICSWPLISKAIRVSPPFGISPANVEASARDVFLSLAWIGNSARTRKASATNSKVLAAKS